MAKRPKYQPIPSAQSLAGWAVVSEAAELQRRADYGAVVGEIASGPGPAEVSHAIADKLNHGRG